MLARKESKRLQLSMIDIEEEAMTTKEAPTDEVLTKMTDLKVETVIFLVRVAVEFSDVMQSKMQSSQKVLTLLLFQKIFSMTIVRWLTTNVTNVAAADGSEGEETTLVDAPRLLKLGAMINSRSFPRIRTYLRTLMTFIFLLIVGAVEGITAAALEAEVPIATTFH
jgi:hypothetical protein